MVAMRDCSTLELAMKQSGPNTVHYFAAIGNSTSGSEEAAKLIEIAFAAKRDWGISGAVDSELEGRFDHSA
jgi:hypothetical protein